MPGYTTDRSFPGLSNVTHVLTKGYAPLSLSIASLPTTCSPLGYERVYLSFCQVADTLFHIQWDDI